MPTRNNRAQRVSSPQRSNETVISPSLILPVNGWQLTIASPNLITFTYIHIPASTDTAEGVVEMTHPDSQEMRR